LQKNSKRKQTGWLWKENKGYLPKDGQELVRLKETKYLSCIVKVGCKTMMSTSIAIEILLSLSVISDPLDAMLCTGKQQGLSILVASGSHLAS